MSQVGFQDFWVAGSRAYFQREAVAGVVQPWLDFGRLTAVNPSLTPEQVQLYDPASGVRALVDEGVTQIEEAYDIQTSNLSLENLAFLFMANPPVRFEQASAEKAAVAHFAHPERLLKLVDSDTGATKLYNHDAIFGVVIPGDRITTDADDITAMVVTTKTITVTTDYDTTGIILAGDHIIVHREGLATAANARTYTVASTTTSTIVVVEDIAGPETAVTVDITYKDNTSGTTGDVLKQALAGTSEVGDWSIGSSMRGFIKFSENGLKFTWALYPNGLSLNVYSHVAALASRVRLFQPQDAKGAIRGELILIWSRLDNTDQTIREMTVSITPGSAEINDEEFSNFTLSAKVISDLTSMDPAGRVLQVSGTTPTQS